MGLVPNKKSVPRESIQLPDKAWATIVQTLNEQGPIQLTNSPPNRRVHERKRYTKIVRCVVRLKQENSPPATYLVRTRNISVGGAGFFFNSYLHPGTQCHLALLDRNRNGQLIQATIRWCRHVVKNIHEVGVQFAEEIDLERYIDVENTESD